MIVVKGGKSWSDVRCEVVLHFEGDNNNKKGDGVMIEGW